MKATLFASDLLLAVVFYHSIRNPSRGRGLSEGGTAGVNRARSQENWLVAAERVAQGLVSWLPPHGRQAMMAGAPLQSRGPQSLTAALHYLR